MERELISHLLALLRGFCGATGYAPGTVGKRAASDNRFFDRLIDPSKTFTIRKYDELVAWFSTNWPADLDWPDGVPRPAPVSGDPPVAPADCPPAPEGAGGAFPEAAE